MFTLLLLGLISVAHGAAVVPTVDVLKVDTEAVTLTPDNYDYLTFGKSFFINFQGPKCGHCKKMKPAWDALAIMYAEDESFSDASLIASVDCANEGRVLCDMFQIQTYPT